MSDHFISNNLFFEIQFAIENGRSMNDTISVLINWLTQDLEANEYEAAKFLDLS